MEKVVHEMDVMLSTPKVAGVPQVYNELWSESTKLEDVIRILPDEDLDESMLLARAYFEPECEDVADYTPLSCLTNKMIIASKHMLGLMDAQTTAFMPFYIANFGVTMYSKQLSSLFIMTGPPGTGKSTVLTKCADCVAKALVWKRDSASAKADTGLGVQADLRLVITDEYKKLKGATPDSDTKNEQTRICDGYIVHERLEHNPSTGAFATKRYVVVCRRSELTSTNMPQDIEEAVMSRACMLPLTLLGTVDSKKAMSANMSLARKGNPNSQEIEKAWQICLQHLSALQVRVNALEAFGGLPPIDERCFELFWAVLEVTLGKDTMESRRTGDLLIMARNVCTMNAINVWHMWGLGAKYDYDRTVESLWYAYSRYLRMEDVVVAYVLLEQSRSLTKYITLVMKSLKSSIAVVNGTMVCCGDYWVVRETKHLSLMRKILSDNREFGSGLCEKLYGLIEKTMYDGLPCIKWEIYDMDGQTAEFFMVSKRWMATVRGPAEEAIVSLLQRLARDGENTNVFPEYTKERDLVFNTKLRGLLANPTPVATAKYEELRPFKESQIQHGFCLLQEQVNSETGAKLISKPGTVKVAVYRPDNAAGVVQSAVHPGRFKIGTDISMPLMVSPDLWEKAPDESGNANSVSHMIQTVFAIAGGYGNKYITGGANTEDLEMLKDAYFLIDPATKCQVTIRNPHYVPSTVRSAFGKSRKRGDQRVGGDDLFPPGEREILLTEKTHFEERVRAAAARRVAISPDLAAVFAEAHMRVMASPPPSGAAAAGAAGPAGPAGGSC